MSASAQGCDVSLMTSRDKGISWSRTGGWLGWIAPTERNLASLEAVKTFTYDVIPVQGFVPSRDGRRIFTFVLEGYGTFDLDIIRYEYERGRLQSVRARLGGGGAPRGFGSFSTRPIVLPQGTRRLLVNLRTDGAIGGRHYSPGANDEGWVIVEVALADTGRAVPSMSFARCLPMRGDARGAGGAPIWATPIGKAGARSADGTPKIFRYFSSEDLGSGSKPRVSAPSDSGGLGPHEARETWRWGHGDNRVDFDGDLDPDGAAMPFRTSGEENVKRRQEYAWLLERNARTWEALAGREIILRFRMSGAEVFGFSFS